MPIIISCATYGSKNKDKKEFTDKGIMFLLKRERGKSSRLWLTGRTLTYQLILLIYVFQIIITGMELILIFIATLFSI